MLDLMFCKNLIINNLWGSVDPHCTAGIGQMTMEVWQQFDGGVEIVYIETVALIKQISK